MEIKLSRISNTKTSLMKMLPNIMTKYFIFITNIFIACLLISYIIYIRLFVARLPKNLDFVYNNTIQYKIIILVLISFSICNYLLITNIITIFFQKSSNRFTLLINKINDIIQNAVFEFYALVIKFIPKYSTKMSLISSTFYGFFHKRSEAFFLFILFFIRIIIVIAFLCDIFIFFKLEYMYKVLYLLCLSILVKTFIYMLRDYSNNMLEIKKYLIITSEGYDVETKLPITSYSLKDDFNHLNLEFYVLQYILCSKITGYLEMYDRYATFFNPYFNVIIYAMYIIGWFYVLVYNFLTII